MTQTELEVFSCEDCGTQVFRIQKGDQDPQCCGQTLKRLIPNTTEASSEKHIPVYEFLGNSEMLIRVGSTNHPMTPAHHIGWIAVVFENSIIYEKLTPEMAPQSTVQVKTGFAGKIYAWCNLHGLWAADF